MAYSPSALVVQDTTWQANDPLVHYTAGDLINRHRRRCRCRFIELAPAIWAH